MIGKVTKGNGAPKLLWYLWGPGRANEHTDPHLIASWDPDADLTTLEPEVTNGRHDVRPLAHLLEQPLAAQTRLPKKTVWQCSLRLAPDDRPLTDAEWDHAAREVLHRTGFAPRHDPDACRWIAMRHGPDHIHLVVTLARQDGHSVTTRNDYYKLGEACRDLEKHFELRRTNPRDRTGPRRPSRAELEKSQRGGKLVTARDELRREVRLAALAADTPEDFLQRLRERGVLVRPRFSQQDSTVMTGYSVAWPGDRTAAGDFVWFGGSKLSADLSWTRLQERWNPHEAISSNERDVRVARSATSTGTSALDTLNVLNRASRSLHTGRSRHRNRDLQQLERATVTLLLALTGQGSSRRKRDSVVLLRDRSLPAPRNTSPASREWLVVILAAKWALQHPPRGADLERLKYAAARLLRDLDLAAGTTDELHHISPNIAPMLIDDTRSSNRTRRAR